MSTFKCPITTIKAILPHPGADALEIARVYDYDVIVAKGLYFPGDTVIYVPVGSVLSKELEARIFPPGSKIKLDNGRIKAIKLRGIVSQGMLIEPMVLPNTTPYNFHDNFVLEQDVSEYLGITKYQPKITEAPVIMRVNPNTNPNKNSDFKEYTDVEHGKYYAEKALVEDELVVVTQKLHGTSARYGWFPKQPKNILERALNALGLLPKWEWCWGSRRCQIQAKPGKKHDGFKSEAQGVNFDDVYTKIGKQEKLKYKVPYGYAIYGEIVGWGIQKGYLYNCGLNEHDFWCYDVYNVLEKRWLDHNEMEVFCIDHGIKTVPVLTVDKYSKELVEALIDVNIISGEVNEGIVVKPVKERISSFCGRVVLKFINEEYLLRDQTEFQ